MIGKFKLTCFFYFILFSLLVYPIRAQERKQKLVYQSSREIPIIKTVDVLIIGGTIPAVSAAIVAAENGESVFLIESKPYLGEDLCATLRLKINSANELKTKIEKQIFGDSNTTTPMHVKGVLSKALINAGVEFVFGSFVTDIIWNENNKPAGVVIANRAGRQAIVSKTIIDASSYATVCQMAGAESKPWQGGNLKFERTIIMAGKTDNQPEYEKRILQLSMPDLSFASFAKAEQLARKESYTDKQLRASESLFFILPNPIVCKKNKEEWFGSSNKTEHFQVDGFDNLFVLSGCAGIPRDIAESLLQPGAMASIGEDIGNAASQIAKSEDNPKGLFIKEIFLKTKESGDVNEILNGFRTTNEK